MEGLLAFDSKTLSLGSSQALVETSLELWELPCWGVCQIWVEHAAFSAMWTSSFSTASRSYCRLRQGSRKVDGHFCESMILRQTHIHRVLLVRGALVLSC